MKLSTRTTYGLKALIYLANSNRTNVSLSEISKDEKISLKYLEAIFSRLKNAGIVMSDRGSNGGYTLKDTPDKISIAKIFEALEGPKAIAGCKTGQRIKFCAHGCHCGVSQVTDSLNQSISQTLNQLSLRDISQDQDNETNSK